MRSRRVFIRDLSLGSVGLAGATALGWAYGGGLDRPALRPNIVVLLADDMGYRDVGCFGGEIDTPAIDRLAAGGLRSTHFHNASRCCPSRDSLLTGLHRAERPRRRGPARGRRSPGRHVGRLGPPHRCRASTRRGRAVGARTVCRCRRPGRCA